MPSPIRRLSLVLLLAGLTALAANPVLVEAELAADADWSSRELADASGGRVLAADARAKTDSRQVSVAIPAAGRYRVWVRYFRPEPKPAGLLLLLRDDAAEVVAFRFCDWSPVMPTEQPYAPPTSWAGAATGWVWEPFDAVFERPQMATVEFGGYATGAARRREGSSERLVDCLILSADAAFDPRALDAAGLAALAAASVPAVAPPEPPAGLLWATGSPLHVDAFAGLPAGKQRFEAGMINNGANYRDESRLVRLGFNHDHAAPTAESLARGILTHAYVESYRMDARKLPGYDGDEGKAVNAEGKVAGSYSYNFQPALDHIPTLLEERMKRYLDDPLLNQHGAWRTSVEDGGFLDYSPVAQAAFRDWLRQQHGDIATLNARWGTDFADFAAITPPPTFAAAPGVWLAFRDFSGQSYTHAVASQMPALARLDPKGRPAIGANSNLDLLAPFFSAFRPVDFDELLNTAYKDQPHVSWDTYCTDDQIGCETDMMASFAEGRKPIIQEWSNHAVDARLAARSYWTMVSKGVAGIYIFMFQEGRGHATYPKWAVLNHEGYPKSKLAAYADAAQEVHRLEPLLMTGAYTHAVKPVALYWSRMDLSIAPTWGSLYGCTLNSPLHVYATLRGLGYPVRWITPRQVRAGQLDGVSALVLPGCRYIPGDVAAAMEGWVKAGGVIIGDELPGAWNEYARPQSTLAPVFGVQTLQATKPKGGDLAIQESIQGYGEVTDAAVERTTHFRMVDEMAQQPGATHPVARAVGDFMLSGIGPERITCVDGTVIGMTHRGYTGLVINDYGQGKALYSALMLGTLYESGGTPYEWNDTHAGLAWPRILDAFLQWAGVPKAGAAPDLNPALRAKLRIESPIVTPDGNLSYGLVSFNDAPVPAATLRLALPDGARGPFAGVYATVGGSRALLRLQASIDGDTLVVAAPGFDTHASILALRDAAPLVAVDLPGITRGTAGLATLQPDQTITLHATVHNPSPRDLAPGALTLTLPAGWLQSAQTLDLPSIRAGASATVAFTIRTPAVAGPTRLRPILARFQAGDISSTPATEMVWWGQPVE